METLLVLSALAWVGVWLVPWRPWSTCECIEPGVESESRREVGAADSSSSDSVASKTLTVLIPARNEAGVIERTLHGARIQGSSVRVILVDDQSTDATQEIARGILEETQLQIVPGRPLEAGWSGKLWALEQAWQAVSEEPPEYLLLLDADIELSPGMARALVNKLREKNLDLVSVMAQLRMESFWEKMLVPAFVYFFKLLYPFALSNDPKSRIAAAAGGCILIKTAMLREIGGFAAIRGALIDDCALARKVKNAGGRTWLGLSHSVRSHRPYLDLRSLWEMVARSAFTQLRYSVFLLVLTTALLVLVFWMPCIGLFTGHAVSGFACAVMIGVYIPTLRYYGRSPLWALALPLVGTLYLLMTWSSAIRCWQGRRSSWKGRIYATKAGGPSNAR